MNLSLYAKDQRGVSLIESLVAMFVLALGILGLAGLQTRTITETRLTNARAAAIRMASDIHERMKLNAAAQSASITNGTPNPYIVGWGAVPAPTNCNTNNCTADQLAGFDLSQWKATINAALPGGDGLVFQSPDDPEGFGVLIAWTDNPGAQAAADPAAYAAPFATLTGVATATCPAGATCHLTRIRP